MGIDLENPSIYDLSLSRRRHLQGLECALGSIAVSFSLGSILCWPPSQLRSFIYFFRPFSHHHQTRPKDRSSQAIIIIFYLCQRIFYFYFFIYWFSPLHPY